MQHHKIAHMLKLAGTLAIIGVVFVFYAMPIVAVRMGKILDLKSILMIILSPAIAALPYLLALRNYFSICANIGMENSFSMENVQLLRGIAHLFLLDCGLWIALALFYIISGGNVCVLVIVLLFIMANLALALLAQMLSRLLARAEELQAENDLTI